MDTTQKIDARIIQEFGLLNNEKVKEFALSYETSPLLKALMILDQLDLKTLKVISTYCELRLTE